MQFLTLLGAAASLLVTGASAAVHGLHSDHHGLARRVPGDMQSWKRVSNSKWSYYDTETGNAYASCLDLSLNEFLSTFCQQWFMRPSSQEHRMDCGNEHGCEFAVLGMTEPSLTRSTSNTTKPPTATGGLS